ncbi:hypothetical protein M23134_02227 [Microscilla marina ATCC 23134]|uniref:Uncharacterized protein n=1 Tax=Microscilla marina ATCC 23134 TaxID=313606 RepID=A1ZNK6_MICM2|nr:hypothetical protein M23134_02227 [Microscilla marina ATCC 23134]
MHIVLIIGLAKIIDKYFTWLIQVSTKQLHCKHIVFKWGYTFLQTNITRTMVAPFFG